MAHATPVIGAFHRWLIFAGLVAAGFWVAADRGLLAALVKADTSAISLVILAFFAFFSINAGWRSRRLDTEMQHARQLCLRARQSDPLLLLDDDGRLLVDGLTAETSCAHEHMAFLAEKCRQQRAIRGQELLLDRLEVSLRRGHQTGWFVADLMVRLGLLGTVIGFIYMLGSITDVQNVDIHAMQQLLTSMSDGMRIALYTTLAGLSAGILLGFQYQLLDQAVDRLLSEIVELSEVHAARHLHGLFDH